MTALPRAALRLFHHCEEEALTSAPAHLIQRLLEDGDSRDLAWMLATFGEEQIRRTFAERGARQLSARSRAFFSLLFEQETGPSGPARGDLWPL